MHLMGTGQVQVNAQLNRHTELQPESRGESWKTPESNGLHVFIAFRLHNPVDEVCAPTAQRLTSRNVPNTAKRKIEAESRVCADTDTDTRF